MAHTISRYALGGHVAGAAFRPSLIPPSSCRPSCSPAPIDRCAMAGNAPRMNRYRTPLADEASTLLAAATKLDDDASQPASVERLTSWPSDVEEVLRALSDATQHAADDLIPAAS